MPKRAPKSCRMCGIAHTNKHAYCDGCASLNGKNWQRSAAEERAHRARYGARWQQLRNSLLANEPLCRVCAAAGRTTAATEIDHITPVSAGGSDHPNNLQPICRNCHQRKTAGEGAAARNADRGG